MQSPSSPSLAPLDNAFLIPADQLEIGPVIAVGGQGQACIERGVDTRVCVRVSCLRARMFMCTGSQYCIFWVTREVVDLRGVTMSCLRLTCGVRLC